MFYVVGTPIGNLEDLTFRAKKVLEEVDYIFAEDTRVTKRLLSHYEIEKTVYQYHEHNKLHQIQNVINLLKGNKNIALVTDAGTPCISDPGFELVNEILKNNLKVKILFQYKENRSKIDVDNGFKLLIDSMKGLIFEDDCQIYKLSGEKEIGMLRDEIHISIEEIE